jgi:sugar phosphate permease
MPGLISLAVAYVLSQFYRSFLAVLTPQLTAELGADKADLSLASGLWFITFGLMQFVVGVCLDRYGPRRTAGIIFGFAGTSGAIVFTTAQSPTAIIIAMSLFGVACSPVLMATLFIFARRFDMRQFAIMTSSFVAFGNLGNVIGASPLATAVDIFGWRTVMAGLGVLTFIMSVIILKFLKDPETEPSTGLGWSGYITLLKSRALWAILLMTLFCYAPVAGIRGLWAGPYLSDLFGADSLQIGQVTFWMAMAMIVGSLAYGPLDRVFNTRKWVVFTGNAIVFCVLAYFVLNPVPSLGMVTALFITLGICGTSYGVLMAHGRTFLPNHLIGRGVTLMNFGSIFGVGLMQFVTGGIVSGQADPASPATYQILFGTYAAVVLVALLVYLTSKDSPPKKDVSS